METKTNLERIIALEEKVESLETTAESFKDYSKKANEINADIRKKYTPSAELAILRKTVAILLKNQGISYDQFTEYNEWAESHKKAVNEEETTSTENVASK